MFLFDKFWIRSLHVFFFWKPSKGKHFPFYLCHSFHEWQEAGSIEPRFSLPILISGYFLWVCFQTIFALEVCSSGSGNGDKVNVISTELTGLALTVTHPPSVRNEQKHLIMFPLLLLWKRLFFFKFKIIVNLSFLSWKEVILMWAVLLSFEIISFACITKDNRTLSVLLMPRKVPSVRSYEGARFLLCVALFGQQPSVLWNIGRCADRAQIQWGLAAWHRASAAP